MLEHRKLIPERKKKIWEGLYDKENEDIRNEIKAATKQALRNPNRGN